MTNGQVITYGSFAAAFVVCIDYFFKLAAPPAIIAAGTTIFTGLFMFLWPVLQNLRNRAA